MLEWGCGKGKNSRGGGKRREKNCGFKQLQIQRQTNGCEHSSEQFSVQEPKPMNSEHPRVPPGNPPATHTPRTNDPLIHSPSIHFTLGARYEQVTQPLMSPVMVWGGRQQFYLEKQEAQGRRTSVKLDSL